MINNYEILTGISDFRKLVSSDGLTVDPNRLFIDKSLFIKDFIDSSGDVLLITRPRRWGKSSMLSMLQHFFSKEVEGKPTKDLFNNLKITEFLNNSRYSKYQGVHPVILVSFKELKGDSFESIEQKIKGILAKLYAKYDYILKALRDQDPKFYHDKETYKISIDKFIRIMRKKADNDDLTDSLRFLSELLTTYHNKRTFILIDEYDNAINNAFNKSEILEKLTTFFSNLFGACLKENEANLEKGLVTGILRVAKANIFSGLNNLEEYTVLDPEFNEYYGFTEVEVNGLLERVNIKNKQEIKVWYNGYIMVGGNTLYNPWSIMRCIGRNGVLDKYWAESGNPQIIEDLLINKSSMKDKQKIRDLIKYKETILETDLKKQVSFDDLQYQSHILWSLLIHTGYLTLVKENDKRQVKLPNQEVILLIKDYVDNWFVGKPFLSKTANSLLAGDFVKFEEAMKEVFGDPAYSARIFSGGGRSANMPEIEKTKEFVYQFLIMTELRCVNLVGDSEYEVFAEIEDVSSGKTRPDVLVLNHKQKLCIVVEIKSSIKANENLKKLAEIGLAQIDQNQYGRKYEENSYQILKLGIAFKGDNFELAYEGKEY
ncbi:MAG: AAA family ATPase [Gammaproteobacteria bacterium]